MSATTESLKRKHDEEETVQVKIIEEDDVVQIEMCECDQCIMDEGTNNAYNCKMMREEQKWNDKDVHTLIEIWSTKEILFNMKHQLYYNKDERMKAIDTIRDDLHEKRLMYTSKQINDKITNLRTYYGGQKRLIEASKKNETGDLYVSKWKFFSDMSFISENIIHRGTHDISPSSSLARDINDEDRSSSPPSSLPINASYSKTYKRLKMKGVDADIYSNRSMLSPVGIADTTTTNRVIHHHHTGKSNDEIFGDLITRMICDIPECHEKAMLKIELQHKIVTTQYKIAAQNKVFN